MRDLFGKVHLEVAEHSSPGSAPSPDSRIVRIFEEVSELFENLVERLVSPWLEHGHEWLHTGGRFSRNAEMPSTASCVRINVSR